MVPHLTWLTVQRERWIEAGTVWGEGCSVQVEKPPKTLQDLTVAKKRTQRTQMRGMGSVHTGNEDTP